MMSNKPWIIFARAQVAAFSGGLTDYILMIVLTELGNLYYPFSIMISGLTGAVINFYINRLWVFRSGQMYSSVRQMSKFACVVAGSICLKTGGTYILVNQSGIDYKFSRLIVDSFVSYGFNFVLIKYWVFREAEMSPM